MINGVSLTPTYVKLNTNEYQLVFSTSEVGTLKVTEKTLNTATPPWRGCAYNLRIFGDEKC